jgi:hypothetical protein
MIAFMGIVSYLKSEKVSGKTLLFLEYVNACHQFYKRQIIFASKMMEGTGHT